MLQSLHHKAKGLLSWFIVGLISLTFIMVGAGDFFTGRSGQNVAKVNGKKISWYDVNQRFEQIARQVQYAQNRDLEPHELSMIRNYAKQLVVEHQAMVDSAENYGFKVSDNAVLEALRSNPAFQENGQFSTLRYQQMLMSQHPPVNDVSFRQQLKQDLVLQQPQTGVTRSSFLLPNELSTLISLQEQKRDFQYLIVPVDRFLNEYKPSDEAVAEYYEKNFKQFTDVERVSVQYLELSIEQLMSQVEFSEDNLVQYYEQHIDQYETPELLKVQHILIADSENDSDTALKVKAEQLLSELNQGASFSDLAKQHSSDTSSAQQGGDMGWIGRGELPDQALEDAVFQLEKNRVAGPIKSRFGYHIIKLNDKQEAHLKTFDKVKDEIKNRYTREQAEYLLSERAEELSNLTFEQPDTLEVAANSLGLSIKTSGLFTRDSGTGIADLKEVRFAAFNEDVLLGQNNSELIKLNEEAYLVLRLKDHVPARQKAMDEVANEIKLELKQQMAKERVLEFANTVKESLAGSDIKTLSKQHDLKFNDKSNVMRFEQSVPAPIMNQAFSMPRPDSNASVSQVAIPGGDVAIIVLTQVKDGDINDTDPSLQDAYSSNYAHARAQLEYALYSSEMVNYSDVAWLD